MKKTIIALMLSSLSLGAMADVTLYGEIKGGLEHTKQKAGKNTVTNVNDWGSFIGFKGYEELGEGLKAIWQVEQYVSLDSRSKKNRTWADRESFIGLETAGGTIRAGHLADSVKSLEDIVDPWDGNGIRKLWNYTRTAGYLTGIRYDSPDFGGFTFNVAYSPEDNNRYNQVRGIVGDLDGFEVAAPVLNNVSNYHDVISAGLGYTNSGFLTNYAFKQIKFGDVKGQVHNLVFGYDANKIYSTVGFQYAKDFDGRKTKVKEGTVSFAYEAGPVTPRISYVHGEKSLKGQSLKQKYDQIVLGADYAFSKRTTALLSAGWLKNSVGEGFRAQLKDRDFRGKNDTSKGKLEAYSVGLGLRHKF